MTSYICNEKVYGNKPTHSCAVGFDGFGTDNTGADVPRDTDNRANVVVYLAITMLRRGSFYLQLMF